MLPHHIPPEGADADGSGFGLSTLTHLPFLLQTLPSPHDAPSPTTHWPPSHAWHLPQSLSSLHSGQGRCMWDYVSLYATHTKRHPKAAFWQCRRIWATLISMQRTQNGTQWFGGRGRGENGKEGRGTKPLNVTLVAFVDLSALWRCRCV